LPELRAIVVYAPDGASDATIKAANKGAKVRVYTWQQFMALGDEVSDATLEERMDSQQPGEVCTLIYTSGTTGNPKAVMITHDNIGFTAHSLIEAIGGGFGDTDEHVVSYLPLSHIAAQMVDVSTRRENV
jgi:long-chain-fatty-acid--CoA ligase ACSBG